MSRFCRDCLARCAGRRDALSGLRLAAARPPPRTRPAHHRACRLRRLLRHDRKTRRSVPARQAGDRRRRQARRGRGRCYVARTYGIRSAMPMFEAQAPLPARRGDQAEHGEIRQGRPRRAPRHAGADAAGRAAVDRRGLSRSDRHRAAARHERRQACWRVSRAQVERDLGITVSIGLSANKFLAKIASDLDKPRGFAVLGQDEAAAFLAPKPVGFIYGVGAVSAAKLAADGYRADRRPAARRRARSHPPLRRGRRAAVAAGARHRHARRSIRSATPRAFRRKPPSSATSANSARSNSIYGI